MSTSADPPSRKLVLLSLSFYMTTAIIMIIVNKWVLNAVSVPLTFLFLQILLAIALLQICQLFGWLNLPAIQRNKCEKLWPLIAVNVIGLASNTYTLQMVDASFYQVARSLVLPFTVILSGLLLRESSSTKILLCCLIVCTGFITGVMGELNSFRAPPLGIFFGIFSSGITALHTIVIKKSLDVVQGGTLDLVYYNNVLSAVALLPICAFSGEGKALSQLIWGKTGAEVKSTDGASELNTFLFGVLITGFFGFLINIAGFLQVKITSPVTHCISSAVRGVLQTIVAVIAFGDIVTTSRASGIFLILLGGMAYTIIKDKEMKTKRRGNHARKEEEEMAENLEKGKTALLEPEENSRR